MQQRRGAVSAQNGRYSRAFKFQVVLEALKAEGKGVRCPRFLYHLE